VGEGAGILAAADAVRRMAGAPAVTAGCVEIGAWLLGYRQVAEAMPLPAAPAPEPGELPPPTPSVDEIFRRLGGN
jgi:hypothetical protein